MSRLWTPQPRNTNNSRAALDTTPLSEVLRRARECRQGAPANSIQGRQRTVPSRQRAAMFRARGGSEKKAYEASSGGGTGFARAIDRERSSCLAAVAKPRPLEAGRCRLYTKQHTRPEATQHRRRWWSYPIPASAELASHISQSLRATGGGAPYLALI